MDMLQRSISKLSRLCVNQDAKIATIRATLVAALLAGLLLVLMNLSSAEEDAKFTTSINSIETSIETLNRADFRPHATRLRAKLRA